eukprot:scaffold262679_cov17-Tisochrysis_lutea.AAC.1
MFENAEKSCSMRNGKRRCGQIPCICPSLPGEFSPIQRRLDPDNSFFKRMIWGSPLHSKQFAQAHWLEVRTELIKGTGTCHPKAVTNCLAWFQTCRAVYTGVLGTSEVEKSAPLMESGLDSLGSV